VLIAALLGVLCLAGCGGDDTAKPPATTATQPPASPAERPPQVVDLTLAFVTPHFRPDPVVLRVGEPVQFKVSSADTRHFLVIEALGIELEVPQKALGQAVTTPVVTPQQVGTFRMRCRIHARLPMEGTVEIQDAAAAHN
jgi:plastocyanin